MPTRTTRRSCTTTLLRQLLAPRIGVAMVEQVVDAGGDLEPVADRAGEQGQVDDAVGGHPAAGDGPPLAQEAGLAAHPGAILQQAAPRRPSRPTWVGEFTGASSIATSRTCWQA